jgi:cobalt/nickel transport system permease protein
MFSALITQHSALGTNGLLFAIHLPDNVIGGSWCIGGFILTGLLMWLGAWRIRDEEIPRVAIMASAFFIASQIHVPLPVGTAHLLLNGLLGVVLGPRALLAIPLALFLQMALFGHGGWTTLGINSCIMSLPALLAWLLFSGIRTTRWINLGGFRPSLVAFCAASFLLSIVFGITTLVTNHVNSLDGLDITWASSVTFYPGTLLAIVACTGLAVYFEKKTRHGPEFSLGLFIGEITVLATVTLNSLTLVLGGLQNYQSLALLILVVHLPLAVIEGIILGITIAFLARVKPEMVGWSLSEKNACAKESWPVEAAAKEA